MEKIISTKLQLATTSSSTPKKDRITKRSTLTSYIGRHAAEKLEVNDFIDLTDDQRCFVCNKVILHSFHLLSKTVTNATKTQAAQKLGELVGERYIVVVSEDDYICQSCFNLLNRLDNLESDLRNVKTGIMKLLENTYLDPEKGINTLPSYIYKALQILINKDQDEKKEPPKKKKCSENKNIFKNVEFQNYASQYTKCIKTEACTKKLTQTINQHYNSMSTKHHATAINKENHINYQNTGKRSLDIPEHLLSKQNDLHAQNSIKINQKNQKTIVEHRYELFNTGTSVFTNKEKKVDQLVKISTLSDAEKQSLLNFTTVSPQHMMLFTDNGNMDLASM